MKENTTTVEKKKSRWTKAGDLATISMPGGEQYTFNFSRLSNEVFAYYGKKQWLSDATAGVDADERLATMIDTFKEAIKEGVELSETGKISIVGKTRANAAPKTMDAKVLPLLSTFTPAEVAGLKFSVKMGLVKLSPELLAKLETMGNEAEG